MSPSDDAKKQHAREMRLKAEARTRERMRCIRILRRMLVEHYAETNANESDAVKQTAGRVAHALGTWISKAINDPKVTG